MAKADLGSHGKDAAVELVPIRHIHEEPQPGNSFMLGQDCCDASDEGHDYRVPPGPPPAAVGDQPWHPKLPEFRVKFSLETRRIFNNTKYEAGRLDSM